MTAGKREVAACTVNKSLKTQQMSAGRRGQPVGAGLEARGGGVGQRLAMAVLKLTALR